MQTFETAYGLMLTDNIARSAIVLFPVWCALALWFLGSLFRITGHSQPFAICWFVGSLMMIVHIVASYGVVHQWSHAAAIEATRQQSLEVTGIAAGWGVYANFVFALTWLGYSALKVARYVVSSVVERSLFAFQTLIVFSATVVFEVGAIRWLSLLGFLIVSASLVYSVRRKSIQKRSSDG